MRRFRLLMDRGVSRFLRSRGDAPQEKEAARAAQEVPPLARRCAAIDHATRSIEVGSSARAEMRPPQPENAPPQGRFLRSRGDAPEAIASRGDKELVPPLARRCAACPRRLAARSAGSSARAEMRRRGCGEHPWRGRFLRSRGDAPPKREARTSTRRVPPLARRCAQHAGDATVTDVGSSARAEMRPFAASSLG